MRTNIFYLSFLFFALHLSYAAKAEGLQSVNFNFQQADNWTVNSTNATATVADGHLNCTMGNQGSSYRGDLWYNNSSSAGLDLSLDPSKDVYLAIKFIGDRPHGALKMEMQRVSEGTLSWYNTQWNGGNGDGNITTTANNKIYYFRLTKDAEYAGETVSIRRIHFVVADAKQEPYAYAVDWVATFTSLEDLEAYKDSKDDGEEDADEGSIDPATLDGYIYNPFTGGADGWTNATSQRVFRNDNRLIVENTGAASLQARRNGVPINATNFPYLAIKVDALPEGFTEENFHIQTNCSALGINDSWYSVIEKKGDVYVFDMTSCVHKTTGASQDAILTTNNADVWIDFGAVSEGAAAQIAWIKTFQTKEEISAETADPLSKENNSEAGRILFEFNDDHASNTQWEWRTPHWQDGENGCKVSATNGQLVLDPDGQVGVMTRASEYLLNTTNYPYLVVKADDMGDAGYFNLKISSLAKGEYAKSNLDASVTVKGNSNNIFAFDLSAYRTYSTATDVNLRMDFYQGTSGTTAPTSPVKIDWIRSYSSLEALDEDLNGTGTNFRQLTGEWDVTILPANGKIALKGIGQATIEVFNFSGQKVAEVNASEVTVPAGNYIVKVTANGITKVSKAIINR